MKMKMSIDMMTSVGMLISTSRSADHVDYDSGRPVGEDEEVFLDDGYDANDDICWRRRSLKDSDS